MGSFPDFPSDFSPFPDCVPDPVGGGGGEEWGEDGVLNLLPLQLWLLQRVLLHISSIANGI